MRIPIAELATELEEEDLTELVLDEDDLTELAEVVATLDADDDLTELELTTEDELFAELVAALLAAAPQTLPVIVGTSAAAPLRSPCTPKLTD